MEDSSLCKELIIISLLVDSKFTVKQIFLLDNNFILI